MTSLLGRLLPLFIGARRVEDLFTEVVARLFERRPELCLSWLDELGLTTPVSKEDRRYINVTTQKSFVALAKAELESFAGNKLRHMTHTMWELRNHLRYGICAPLHGDDLFCDLGYQLGRVDESAHSSLLRISSDGYPAVYVFLEAQPGAMAREASVGAMRKVALNPEWEAYNLDDPTGWAGVRRAKSFADLLSEEDHVAAVKTFFIESIRQLREELTAFKEEQPDLPWGGR